MPYLYSVVSIAKVWLCFIWHIIFLVGMETLSPAMVGVSLIFAPYFFLSFIGWVVRPILRFSLAVLMNPYILALSILVSSWIISVQTPRLNWSERFWVAYWFLAYPCWIEFSRDRSHFSWANILLVLLRPVPVRRRKYWFPGCSCFSWSWGVIYWNNF